MRIGVQVAQHVHVGSTWKLAPKWHETLIDKSIEEFGFSFMNLALELGAACQHVASPPFPLHVRPAPPCAIPAARQFGAYLPQIFLYSSR